MSEQHSVRLLVIADDAGKVLAAINLGGRREGDAPLHVGADPLSGQTVHEVDAPEELIRPGTAPETFQQYVLRTEAGAPRLVKRG